MIRKASGLFLIAAAAVVLQTSAFSLGTEQEPAVQEQAAAQSATTSAPAEPERTLHVVATAHLDTQWLWTIQDTINRCIPATLHGNFELFEKYPDYVFSFEGAYRYMLARDYYPEDYAKLKKYIAAGRWRVCGSSVDACDVNVPSPQSLIRQILYGNGFFRREFDKTSCDIYLPDCFGFGYALPSVARHCGLSGFSTQKLTWGSWVGVPFDVGVWEGVDGSTLIAAVNPGSYVAKITEDLATDAKWLEPIDKLGKQSGVYVGYKYFGVGDEGGAPDAESVAKLEEAIAAKGPIRVLSAPADQLYRDLSPEQTAKLPRYNGELLMSRHGTGCYTSQAAMKRWNRKNEQLADAAERAAVIADWLGGAAYPGEKLTEAWVRFLWHQFHDDLTGTSIPQAYTFSWNDETISANQFAAVLTDSAGATARALDTLVQGVPVVVFNPLSIDREDVVEATVKFAKASPKSVRVFGADGKEVASQVAATDGNEVRVIFLAQVPSVGFAVYDVRPADAPSDMKSELKASGTGIENHRYRVAIDANGDVAEVFDKAANRPLLAAPARLQMLEDTPNNWPEWEIWYDDISAEPKAHVGGPVTVRVVENGPARVTVEITRQAEGSTFVQRLQLAGGEAGDVLAFDTHLDWRTPAMLLKAAFPLAVSNEKATYDLGLGTIQRGNNSDKLWEVPAQQWADLTAADGEYGVAVLNDCKYGWDKPSDNTLRLTLVHSPHNIQKDMGWHRFTYALCGHKNDWREAGVPWLAARLNQPLRAFQAEPHEGPLGKKFSLLSVGSPQVAVTTVKKAEIGDEIVVRLQELHGKAATSARVSMAVPIVTAREVNGAEEPIAGDVPVADGRLNVNLRPYQPRAFALKLGKSPNKLAPPSCTPVQLKFDTDVISLDGNKADGAFDAEGHSLSGELLPGMIVGEGIPFVVGPTAESEKNAVTCAGQVIDLPPGHFDRLYLLAAAAGGDAMGAFLIGDKPVDLHIQDFTGFVGQSQSLVVGGEVVDAARMAEPFVKTDNIAWAGSHRHAADGKNEAHIYTYLYKYGIELPSGAAKLTLPKNDKIKLLAVTVADNPNDSVSPAAALYDQPIAARITPPGGPTIEPVTVTISADIKGAVIRCTLDGAEPTQDSALYAGPFTVAKTTTVKARVFVGTTAADHVASRTFTFVQPRKAEAPADVKPGLHYKYYEGKWRKVAELADQKPIKDGDIESFDLKPRGVKEQFGFDFTGFIDVPKEGVYTFYTKSDDASKLYIGDEQVVDNDLAHGMVERSGAIALSPGKHSIRVLYLQGVGDFGLEVSYEGPDIKRQAIPASALFCTPVAAE